MSDGSSDVCSSDRADDAGLHAHGVLQAADRVLPAGPRIGDKLAIGRGQRAVAILGLEDLIDLLHVEGDVLCLDRNSVVSGQSVSVRVDLGGRRFIKKSNTYDNVRTSTLHTS